MKKLLLAAGLLLSIFVCNVSALTTTTTVYYTLQHYKIVPDTCNNITTDYYYRGNYHLVASTWIVFATACPQGLIMWSTGSLKVSELIVTSMVVESWILHGDITVDNFTSTGVFTANLPAYFRPKWNDANMTSTWTAKGLYLSTDTAFYMAQVINLPLIGYTTGAMFYNQTDGYVYIASNSVMSISDFYKFVKWQDYNQFYNDTKSSFTTIEGLYSQKAKNEIISGVKTHSSSFTITASIYISSGMLIISPNYPGNNDAKFIIYKSSQANHRLFYFGESGADSAYNYLYDENDNIGLALDAYSVSKQGGLYIRNGRIAVNKGNYVFAGLGADVDVEGTGSFTGMFTVGSSSETILRATGTIETNEIVVNEIYVPEGNIYDVTMTSFGANDNAHNAISNSKLNISSGADIADARNRLRNVELSTAPLTVVASTAGFNSGDVLAIYPSSPSGLSYQKDAGGGAGGWVGTATSDLNMNHNKIYASSITVNGTLTSSGTITVLANSDGFADVDFTVVGDQKGQLRGFDDTFAVYAHTGDDLALGANNSAIIEIYDTGGIKANLQNDGFYFWDGVSLVGVATMTYLGDLFIDRSYKGKESVLAGGATMQYLKTNKITSGDTGTATNVWTKCASSDSWAASAGGGGSSGISTVWKTINFYVPGDAFVTSGIKYLGTVGCDMTISSAIVTVTSEGLCPLGTGRTNFDILYSSSDITVGTAAGLPAFSSIFNSTYSLSLVANSSFSSTTDFVYTKLKPNFSLKLKIGEVCATRAGGSPICVSITGRQD